jgi:hypothetical protein
MNKLAITAAFFAGSALGSGGAYRAMRPSSPPLQIEATSADVQKAVLAAGLGPKTLVACPTVPARGPNGNFTQVVCQFGDGTTLVFDESQSKALVP